MKQEEPEELALTEIYRSALNGLSPSDITAVCALSADRVLHLWDDPATLSILSKGLALAWDIADDKEVIANNIDDVLLEIDNIIPDSAEEPERLCSHYVGCAVGGAIESYRNPNGVNESILSAYDAVRHSRDPIIPFPEDKNPNKWGINLCREYNVHMEAIKRIRKAPTGIKRRELLIDLGGK